MSCCNHDCNQGRTCPLRTAQAECHVACSPQPGRGHFFAPGVIEGPHYHGTVLTSEGASRAGRAAMLVVCLVVAVATFGITAGCLGLVAWP